MERHLTVSTPNDENGVKAAIRAVLASSLAMSAVTLLAWPAAAQNGATSAQEPHAAVEEIMVTARRREETLQSVPIAVSAFSGEQIEAAGLTNLKEIAQYVPNVTFTPARATNSTIIAFIRGVGQQDPLPGFDGGVGIYVDDVYMARPQGQLAEVYDIERVEVLRGPQGTLYGRNTIGGAVKFITRPLAMDPEAKIKVSVGTYGQVDAVLSASGPIGDTVRIGATFGSFKRDGFGENLYTGDDNYNKNVLAGRVSLEWNAADDVLVRLAGDYSDDKSNAKYGHRLLVGRVSGAPVLPDVYDTRSGEETIPSSSKGMAPDVEQWTASMVVRWDINEAWQFKSITAYHEDSSVALIDFDSLPVDDLDTITLFDNDQWSQEFQLLLNGDRLSGVMGAYYLEANAYVPRADNVLGPQLAGRGISAGIVLGTERQAWAVFGDFTYKLTDKFSASLGARYTSDSTDSDVYRENFIGKGTPLFGNMSAISITVPVPGAVPRFVGSRSDENTSFRASLSYATSEAHNLYATFSQGFKAGGFDPRGAFQYPAVREGFKPETLNSYELGTKSTWADGRVRTNLAAFYADYNDIQVPSFVPYEIAPGAFGYVGATANAGKARTYGLELDAVAQLTDSFSTSFTLGYIDAKYLEWAALGADGKPTDIASKRDFQNTPDFSGNLTLRYQWPLSISSSAGDLALSAGLTYRGDYQQFEVPDPLLDQTAFTLFDVALVWTSSDQRYQVGIYGKNLTDERYKVAGYATGASGTEGNVTAFYGDPRTVTGTVTIKF